MTAFLESILARLGTLFDPQALGTAAAGGAANALSALREAAYVALTGAGIDMSFETFRIEPVTVKQAAA